MNIKLTVLDAVFTNLIGSLVILKRTEDIVLNIWIISEKLTCFAIGKLHLNDYCRLLFSPL